MKKIIVFFVYFFCLQPAFALTCVDLFSETPLFGQVIKSFPHSNEDLNIDVVQVHGPFGNYLVRRQFWPSIPRSKQFQGKSYTGKRALLLTHHDWNDSPATRSTFSTASRLIEQFSLNSDPMASLLINLNPDGSLRKSAVSDQRIPEGSAAALDYSLRAFPKGTAKTDLFFYTGNFHMLAFHVDDLYMTGGDLIMCLSNSLKSVMLNSRVKRIHLALKGIYSSAPTYWLFKGKSGGVDRNPEWAPINDLQFFPDEKLKLPERLKRLDPTPGAPGFNAAEELHAYTNSELLQFFKEGIFGDSKDGLPYNISPESDGNGIGFTVRLFKGDQFLGLIGEGPNTIDLVLGFDL